MNNLPKKSLIAGLSIAASIAAYFIMPQEGVKHYAYLDGVGVWTICRGHTEGVKKNDVATDPQCDRWYHQDVARAEAAFDRLVYKEQAANVKAAGISFIFNAGAGNFASSSLRRKLNEGKRAEACNQFPRWHYAGGKDCRVKASNCAGIVARREKEKELCLSNEIFVCDYNSGDCDPVRVRPAHDLDQPAGSEAPG